MKNETAMQELFNALASMGLFTINQSVIDTYLKKEKDQIVQSVDFALSHNGVSRITAVMISDFDNEDTTCGEHYYNYKYGKK